MIAASKPLSDAFDIGLLHSGAGIGFGTVGLILKFVGLMRTDSVRMDGPGDGVKHPDAEEELGDGELKASVSLFLANGQLACLRGRTGA